MIVLPYFAPPSIPIVGSLKLEPFGIFAAAGIYLAASLAARMAKKQGEDVLPLLDYAPWGVGGGIVMGHFVHLFLYHPEELWGKVLWGSEALGTAWQILRVWDGLSSFGGLLGGVIAAAIYFRVKGISFWRYADAFALGVAPGWGVARVGCFAVHDHPGTRSDFFLAVDFPGGPRHDLGLYDALALFAFAGVLFALRRAGAMTGRLLPLLAVMYGIQRFFTDFLRATDVVYRDKRYFDLTPAQYGCILLVIFGIYQIAKRRAPAAAPPASAKTASAK
ncbi:MAG TPA: prolipoprotein diacylglyceryl transferase family protein [Myxococcaceae bacterium]|nr:prolipoprotein diacylglyceryl transferase family protein [Myxococcaceae bacterium]